MQFLMHVPVLLCNDYLFVLSYFYDCYLELHLNDNYLDAIRYL